MASGAALYITIVTDANGKAKHLADRAVRKSDQGRDGVNALIDLLSGIAGGNYNARVLVALAGADTGTAGTGTVVCTQANATAGDTVTLGATTFTVRASPSTDPKLGEFAAGASDTACGDNLAAAINAHPDFKGLGTAVNVTGTVTLTMADKGLHGNLMQFSTSDATAFAVTSPTNGAEGTLTQGLRVYRRGY
jgi:phage tail sheath gpL-like